MRSLRKIGATPIPWHPSPSLAIRTSSRMKSCNEEVVTLSTIFWKPPERRNDAQPSVLYCVREEHALTGSHHDRYRVRDSIFKKLLFWLRLAAYYDVNVDCRPLKANTYLV